MVERVVLRDGTEAFVWPVLPTDKEALSEEYERLSPGSRYHRSLAEVPHLTSQMLGHLVDEVDGVNHAAWVLCAFPEHGPDALAGIGRIIRYPDKPTTADVAVTVADDWQGKGVASALVEVLRRHPLEGITTVETEVTEDNQAALVLLRRLGDADVTRSGPGCLHVLVRLGVPRHISRSRSAAVEPDSNPALQ